MKIIWKIVLSEAKCGVLQVRMDGEGGSAIGRGATAHEAYINAESKLVIKPWLTSTTDTR